MRQVTQKIIPLNRNGLEQTSVCTVTTKTARLWCKKLLTSRDRSHQPLLKDKNYKLSQGRTLITVYWLISGPNSLATLQLEGVDMCRELNLPEELHLWWTSLSPTWTIVLFQKNGSWTIQLQAFTLKMQPKLKLTTSIQWPLSKREFKINSSLMTKRAIIFSLQ